MKYMGSKSRIAKYIVPIIQSYIDENNIVDYIEPFCGGSNIIDKIKCKNKYALDLDKYLIALFIHLQNGNSLLDKVPRELYADVRTNKEKYEDWYVGNVGFLASYNGRFFDGGYANSGIEKTKNGERFRDYYQEAKNNILKQMEDLKDIEFCCKDYKELIVSSNALIYCDPPYQEAKQYSNSKDFDYDFFWNKMRSWSLNNIVLISELNAPNDFECIWQQEVSRSIKVADKSKSIERLFKIKNT